LFLCSTIFVFVFCHVAFALDLALDFLSLNRNYRKQKLEKQTGN
jgi:hypothetical protein